MSKHPPMVWKNNKRDGICHGDVEFYTCYTEEMGGGQTKYLSDLECQELLREARAMAFEEAADDVDKRETPGVTAHVLRSKAKQTRDHERIYPCKDCGILRSKAEGGTTFSVCDVCWDKIHGDKVREKAINSLAGKACRNKDNI